MPRRSSGTYPYKLWIQRITPIEELKMPAFAIAPIPELCVCLDGSVHAGFLELKLRSVTAVRHIVRASVRPVHSYELTTLTELRCLRNDPGGGGGRQVWTVGPAVVAATRENDHYSEDSHGGNADHHLNPIARRSG